MSTSHTKTFPESIKKETRMKKRMIAAAFAAAAIAVTVPLAFAHWDGYGPGMMGGYGGYGMGPGMMGGYGGHGMGPGMMGSYGSYGMGPGMMGSYGSYGMGPGMMGSYGSYDMGPGMMGGYGPGYGAGSSLNLTDEQRSKIGKIQEDLRTKQWDLMGKIREQYAHRAEASDDAAAGKADDQIGALQQQMLSNATTARKEIDAVLTKEERQQLRRGEY